MSRSTQLTPEKALNDALAKIQNQPQQPQQTFRMPEEHLVASVLAMSEGVPHVTSRAHPNSVHSQTQPQQLNQMTEEQLVQLALAMSEGVQEDAPVANRSADAANHSSAVPQQMFDFSKAKIYSPFNLGVIHLMLKLIDQGFCDASVNLFAHNLIFLSNADETALNNLNRLLEAYVTTQNDAQKQCARCELKTYLQTNMSDLNNHVNLSSSCSAPTIARSRMHPDLVHLLDMLNHLAHMNILPYRKFLQVIDCLAIGDKKNQVQSLLSNCDKYSTDNSLSDVDRSQLKADIQGQFNDLVGPIPGVNIAHPVNDTAENQLNKIGVKVCRVIESFVAKEVICDRYLIKYYNRQLLMHLLNAEPLAHDVVNNLKGIIDDWGDGFDLNHVRGMCKKAIRGLCVNEHEVFTAYAERFERLGMCKKAQKASNAALLVKIAEDANCLRSLIAIIEENEGIFNAGSEPDDVAKMKVKGQLNNLCNFVESDTESVAQFYGTESKLFKLQATAQETTSSSSAVSSNATDTVETATHSTSVGATDAQQDTTSQVKPTTDQPPTKTRKGEDGDVQVVSGVLHDLPERVESSSHSSSADFEAQPTTSSSGSSHTNSARLNGSSLKLKVPKRSREKRDEEDKGHQASNNQP